MMINSYYLKGLVAVTILAISYLLASCSHVHTQKPIVKDEQAIFREDFYKYRDAKKARIAAKLRQIFGNDCVIDSDYDTNMHLKTFNKFTNFETSVDLKAITDSLVVMLEPILGFDKSTLVDRHYPYNGFDNINVFTSYLVGYRQASFNGILIAGDFEIMTFIFRNTGEFTLSINLNQVKEIVPPPYITETEVENIATDRIAKLDSEFNGKYEYNYYQDSLSFQNGHIISNRVPVVAKKNQYGHSKYDYSISQYIRAFPLEYGQKVGAPYQVIYNIDFFDDYHMIVDAKTGKVIKIMDQRGYIY